MYLNIVLTILVVLVLLKFIYDAFLARLIHKPSTVLAKHYGHIPKYYEYLSEIQSTFQKGEFEQCLNYCGKILDERQLESTALMYKAYSQYHLKQYSEAKETFSLLDTLPNQDCSKMIEKIDKILT